MLRERTLNLNQDFEKKEVRYNLPNSTLIPHSSPLPPTYSWNKSTSSSSVWLRQPKRLAVSGRRRNSTFSARLAGN